MGRLLPAHFTVTCVLGIPIYLTVLLGSCIHGQDIPQFFFSVNPHNQDVVEGTEVRLRCDVSDRRHITFQWNVNGRDISNTSRRFQDGSDLRILRVLRGEDEGSFTCIAQNVSTAYSIVSQEARLNIQWISPTAEVQLRRPRMKNELRPGLDMLLRCQVTGNPEPSYLWYHNKFRLFQNERIKMIDGGSRLRISNISAVDNGIYSCRAENVAGARDSIESLILNLRDINYPYLLESRFTRNILVKRNSPAWLDCPFYNATHVDWFSGNDKLMTNSKYHVFTNGTIQFYKVRPADEGSYRCEGISQSKKSQSFSADLTLASLYDFTSDSFEPRLIPNYPMVIPVNAKFEIKCFPPRGNPKATLKWFDQNGNPVPTSGRISVKESSLIFQHSQQSDAGNYTCMAQNLAGEKRKKVPVIVSVAPIVTKAPQPKISEEEQNIHFECRFAGTQFPVTKISWTKDSRQIYTGEFPRHRVDGYSGKLHIFNVQMEDAGNYACQLNTTGQTMVTSSSAYLTVRRKLKFEPVPHDEKLEIGSKATILCQAEGETEPTVGWLRGNNFKFPSHVTAIKGTLVFNGVKRMDKGPYTCVAHSPSQGLINITISVDVVSKPQFSIVPLNTSVYEGQPVILHCKAKGEPDPTVIWDKNRRSAWDLSRFSVMSNGSLAVSSVYQEDMGFYGCTANNSGGSIRAEAFLRVGTEADLRRGFVSNYGSRPGGSSDDEEASMIRTIIIAVCSAGAYLMLVIGLTAFCSYRLLMQRRTRKTGNGQAKIGENNVTHPEQMELLHKDDHESTTQMKSDSDNRSHISGMSSQPSQPSHSSAQSNSAVTPLPQMQTYRFSWERLQFPRNDLQTIGMLGKGIFGDVFLAKACGIRDNEKETLVVVKSLLNKDESVCFDFRQEMDMYSRLDHPNIVRLMGVCREVEPFFTITEYCDWGDLKQFLLATRNDNGKRIARVPPLSLEQKICLCQQVALGMEHMTSCRCVHRDLAARNILLTSRLDVKISNLSLCQDVYSGEYYPCRQGLLPIRWMPPESVLEDEYSVKSDVWSFGVFVWEVFHCADLPYKGRTDEELMKGLKVGDVILEISEQCPEEIIEMIRKCTAEFPKDRPHFGDVCIMIGDLLMNSNV